MFNASVNCNILTSETVVIGFLFYKTCIVSVCLQSGEYCHMVDRGVAVKPLLTGMRLMPVRAFLNVPHTLVLRWIKAACF